MEWDGINTDQIEGSRLFSSLDLASGYLASGMKPEDRAKTAITTMGMLYEFNVRLCNSGTFQSLMHGLYSGQFEVEIRHVYIDDIIIYSRTFGEHLDHLLEVEVMRINLKVQLQIQKRFQLSDIGPFLSTCQKYTVLLGVWIV